MHYRAFINREMTISARQHDVTTNAGLPYQSYLMFNRAEWHPDASGCFASIDDSLYAFQQQMNQSVFQVSIE